jgi:lactoylglutathione lyase
MMITGIAHAAFKVKDIEASVKFYSEILGFKEAFRFHNQDGSLSGVYMYVARGQFIELFPNGKGENIRDNEKAGYSHMCYEVPDAKAAFEEIRSKGTAADAGLKVGISKCIQFWIHDPDGNSIEIMELPPESMQAKANKMFENLR